MSLTGGEPTLNPQIFRSGTLYKRKRKKIYKCYYPTDSELYNLKIFLILVDGNLHKVSVLNLWSIH